MAKSKNILVLMTSPRKDGNTDKLADAFIEGAIENGHIVNKFYASKQKINPCMNCQYCVSHEGMCVQKDSMQEIYDAFNKADVIVLASPLYFHSISAQLKTIIDRFYAVGSYKHFHYEKKESIFLMTCMERDDTIFDQAKSYYHTLLTRAFPWENRGEICVSGLAGERNSIDGHPALKQAKNIGKSL
ncbi:MAG: flavodoxin family protein [Lachnospiraceae bacterium]|nr:flavodoxin family protein [Lachnospiraceae bacterium]